MALTKVNYVDGVTTIMAKNLNDIQDEVIANGTAIASQATQISGKADATALAAETAAREATVSAEAAAREDADTALGDDVDDLKSAITHVSETGELLLDKNVVWNNGYINAAGLVNNSSLSKYSSPFLLKAGETVVVTTTNSNIGIICSTTSDTVAVGDTVTVIAKTSGTTQEETYSYTATEDIKIVICVLWSDHSYKIYGSSMILNNNNAIVAMDDLITGIGNDLVVFTNLYTPDDFTTGGYYSESNGITANSSSVYTEKYAPVNGGEKIYWYFPSGQIQILTYDSSKNFIERAVNSGTKTGNTTLGSNVAYIRVSVYGGASSASGLIVSEQPVDSSSDPTRKCVLRNEVIEEVAGEASGKGSVTKTASKITVTMQNLRIEVIKVDRDDIRAHIWRTNAGYMKDSGGAFRPVWADADTDGVVKLANEDDFVGGYHGDETQTAFHLMIDGVEYAETDTFTDKDFNEIILFIESNVYHCNTSASADVIAFTRNKIITFNKNGYTVENYWTANETNTVNYAYMGMLSVNRYIDSSNTDYLISGYYTDKDYKYTDANTSTVPSNEINDVLFNTAYGDIGIKIDNIKTPDTYRGGVTNYNSASDQRLKVYLNLLGSGTVMQVGDVLRAKATTYTE